MASSNYKCILRATIPIITRIGIHKLPQEGDKSVEYTSCGKEVYFLMKQHTYQQIRVISSNNPADFQEQFNQALTELASKNPKVEFNMTQGHCAYIMYQETMQAPETSEDEFALAGISFHCRNCPKYEWPLTKSGNINRIQKKGDCPIAKYGFTSRDANACEYLYKGILNGSLKPIYDEDLEDFQLK